jgi:ABC-type transport system substrate-binding protein
MAFRTIEIGIGVRSRCSPAKLAEGLLHCTSPAQARRGRGSGKLSGSRAALVDVDRFPAVERASDAEECGFSAKERTIPGERSGVSDAQRSERRERTPIPIVPRFALVALALLASACSAPPPEPDVLPIGLHAKRPASLLPYASGSVGEALGELLYDGGFDLELQGDHFEPMPALFEPSYARWGSTYYVRLRKGARFSAAPALPERDVEPDDVVFTYATLRRRALGLRPLASPTLEAVRLSDQPGWDVRFVFSEDPGKEAFYQVASAKVLPRPPEGLRTSAWLDELALHPAGTGPYRVVEFGETLLLEARTGRKTGPEPRYPRIRVRFSEIPGSLEQELLSGRLAAYAGAWPPDVFEIPPSDLALRYQIAPGPGHYALAFDSVAGALKDPDVRRAVLGLIEPETLLHAVVPDPGASVSYGPWPQPYLSETLAMRPSSLAALGPAPRPGPPPEAELELIWQEESEDKRLTGLIARTLAEQLQRGSRGRVRIGRQHGLDPGSFRLRLQEKRYDLALVRLDLDELPERLGSGPPEQNDTGIEDEVLDELIRRWPRAEDQDERRAIVRALTRRLGEHAAWAWLFTPVYRIYYDSARIHLPPGGLLEMMQAVERW